MDALTLDQFAVFAAVVDEGSFAAAARRMNRAQSAITYAVQKLEDQSGVELFDRSAYRPTLTEAGKAVLPRIRRILSDVEDFRLHAQRMTTGLEDELTINMHPFEPRKLLSRALGEFQKMFPSVRINASTSSRDSALEALRTGAANLAFVHDLVPVGDDFERRRFRQIELVVAASRDHPLAAVEGEIEPDQLRDHTQLAMYGTLSEEEARVIHAHGLDAVSRWRVMDFDIIRDLLIAGVGWGAAPRPLIESDLAAGRLVLLRPKTFDRDTRTLTIPLVVVRSRHRPVGPAARWLFDRIADEASA